MRKIARGNDCMDRNRFKLIHSELIQQVQCVENNLKIIYAAMRKGNFNNNLRSVEKMNLGKIARELEELDYSDDMPEFSEEEYNTIDEIREIRKVLVRKWGDRQLNQMSNSPLILTSRFV